MLDLLPYNVLDTLYFKGKPGEHTHDFTSYDRFITYSRSFPAHCSLKVYYWFLMDSLWREEST